MHRGAERKLEDESENMEGEEIGKMLGRASDLRSKITLCIARTAAPQPLPAGAPPPETDDYDDDEEEAESLIGIRDALQSLEHQLSALQDLQHQQRYQRESALTQIDRSRVKLLGKLKEYNGEDLEVIHEASNFAGGSTGRNEDLLLPPYPSHLPDSYVLDDLYPFTRFGSKSRSPRDKSTDGELSHKAKNMDGSGDKLSNQPPKRTPLGKLGYFVGSVAKSVLAIVGVVSLLSMAGFKPTLENRCIQLNIHELFNKQGNEEREEVKQGIKETEEVVFQCPPGKVLVIEGGEPMCRVKERMEMPIEFDAKAPKVSYGFG